MNENVTVCITPKGEKPVLHFSQFDNERVFTVTVLADDGESAAVLTGLDIEFRLRKTDSHVVTIAPESVADNVITFKTTEQMCACCGQNIASVVLIKDDMIISTLDILVDIQRDILSGGLTSESDIRNLTTQIEQIVPEVIGDDYYTKTEVDELIDDIPTFDPTNYYNKSDVDGLLADKADADDVYTKSDVDGLLADKADTSDVYTKAEADTLLNGKLDKLEIRGEVGIFPYATFNTNSFAPMHMIEGAIDSGVGADSVTLYRTGLNLFSGNQLAENLRGATGYSKDENNKTVRFANATPPYHQTLISGIFKPNKQYTFIFRYTAEATNRSIRIGYSDGTNSEVLFDTTGTKTTVVVTSVSGKNVSDLYLSFFSNGSTTLYYDEFGVFEGVITEADYVAYLGTSKTITFGQTVNGGTIDFIKGVVVDDTTTPPTEQTFDPVTIDTVSGYNNVFFDIGNITAFSYYRNAGGLLVQLMRDSMI